MHNQKTKRSTKRSRTEAQARAWKALSPYRRMLLMSHLPDEFERELNLRSSILTACSNVYGPFQWDATIAVLAEGEAEEVDRPKPADHEPDGMSIREIADFFEIHTTRVRAIIDHSYQKLRCQTVMQELFYGEADEDARQPVEAPVHYYENLIEEAIERAKCTHPR